MAREGREETNIINGNILRPVSKFKCLTHSVTVFKISYGVLNTQSYNKSYGSSWRNFGKNIRKEVQQMSKMHL
jgi:hypothetical protein